VCTDSISGTVNGNAVSLVYEQRKTLAGADTILTVINTHTITGTITSASTIEGNDDLTVHVFQGVSCGTDDNTFTGTGPVEMSITPLP
jgi:hypothetical protein